MLTVLAGGVGAARFLRGLVRVVPPSEITVVSNTGDDIRIYGVHVSPDVDIVTYTLGGVVDEDRGWGLAGETFTLLDGLAKLGIDPWMKLGDLDFATCLARRIALDAGETPASFTARLADRFGVACHILPMTNDPVGTRVLVLDEEGRELDLHFEEYWVRRRARDKALDVRLAGAETAVPAPGVLDAIRDSDTVLIAPSNPIVSIGTILQIRGIRDALVARRGPVVGVSPIIGGAPVRGMADKLMAAAGADVSCVGVARLYADFLDALVIDTADIGRLAEVEQAGVRAVARPTLMRSVNDSIALAKAALAEAERVREPWEDRMTQPGKGSA